MVNAWWLARSWPIEAHRDRFWTANPSDGGNRLPGGEVHRIIEDWLAIVETNVTRTRVDARLRPVTNISVAGEKHD